MLMPSAQASEPAQPQIMSLPHKEAVVAEQAAAMPLELRIDDVVLAERRAVRRRRRSRSAGATPACAQTPRCRCRARGRRRRDRPADDRWCPQHGGRPRRRASSMQTNSVLVPPPSTPRKMRAAAHLVRGVDANALNDAADDAVVGRVGRQSALERCVVGEQLRWNDVREQQVAVRPPARARTRDGVADVALRREPPPRRQLSRRPRNSSIRSRS